MPSAGALRAGRAVIELSLLTKPIEKGLRALQARTRAISSSFSRIGASGIGGGGGISGLRNLFVGSAASAALAWPVKMAANIEVAAAQLGVFTGSTESAKNLLLDMQKFSAVSLIPVENLTQGAALMLRYGQDAQGAAASAKQLAVLAAGSSEEFEKLSLAFAQVASAGRLQGEEMRQFKNTAFNPLREIAERTGESMEDVKKRMEAGEISFAEVAKSLAAATGQGGRFHGLLEAISNTLTGQLKKALATFKMAILPIGEEMLSPLTKLFRAINGIIPAFAQLVKEHLRFVKIAMFVGAVIAASVVAFAALGISLQAIGIAASGFAATFGLISSVVAALVSPLGLIGATAAYVAYEFFTMTEAGRSMVAALSGWFGELYQVATDTFTGIAEALSAGDIQLAANILWLGLKLAFLTGTESLRQVWRDFQDIFIRTFIEATATVQGAWVKMISALKGAWNSFKGWMLDAFDVIVTRLAGIGQSDAIKQQLEAELVRKVGERMQTEKADLARIETEKKDALASIEANRATGQATQDSEYARKQKEAADALTQTRKAFNEAHEAATAASEAAKEGKEIDLGGPGGGIFGGAAKAGDSFKGPGAVFDASLARQIFGDTTEQDQLRQLKIIARNTGRGGGLPVT